MGSVAKVVKKVTKSIKRPISKIVKGVARGIAKVGKSVLRGVGKLQAKLGPLGSIALAIAMPYAMSGLSAGTTGLMNSQNVFLRSIGNVGNAIRTGYTQHLVLLLVLLVKDFQALEKVIIFFLEFLMVQKIYLIKQELL